MSTLASNPLSKTLGQVFTPSPVAEWMTRWACAERPRRVCDPALGDGVFIDALHRAAPHQPANIDAFEVDPLMITAFRRRRCPLSVRLHRRDFITAPATGIYDAVVANPPYVRHHDYVCPDSVFAGFDRQCRRRVSRLTNLYGLFLLKIWQSLAPAGRAAVITPAEWLNADFGRSLKAYFLEENAIDAVVHFGHAARIFDGAMTTAAITLLRRGRLANEPLRMGTVDDVASLQPLKLSKLRAVPPAQLCPDAKWTALCLSARRHDQSAGPRLADVARCMRGIATGANDYFTLRESDRVKWKLDLRDLRPCVAKAAHIPGDRFDPQQWRRLRDAGERVYLLAPRPRLSAAVRRYLDEGQRRGIPARYLPAHRPIWFQPEVREPAPLLVSVFARQGFRFARNSAGVHNLTAFHGIYPKAAFAQQRGAVDRLWKYLNNPAAQDAIVAHQRIYAEGLRKLEPRDVEAIPVPARLLSNA